MIVEFQNPPLLDGYVYTYEQAVEARRKGEILSIRLETCLRCNLNCKYCCNNSTSGRVDALAAEKIYSLIDEAVDLGARSIVVIGGGEPTIDPRFKDFIKYIYNKNVIPVIFTNSQTIDDEMATFLYNHNTRVIIKLDSIDENIQDKLVVKKGALKNIKRTIGALKRAGFMNDSKNLRAGASIVVNKLNVNTVPDTWRFCRDNNLFPNLEMLILNGRAREISDLHLDVSEYQKIKENLLHIDQEEYGYTWLPYTPLVSAGCFQCMYNIYISVDGAARPCSSIHANVANVFDKTLKEIIDTDFFKVSRNIEAHLTGKCFNCVHRLKCVGCRGMAYTQAKNLGLNDIEALCSSDPTCWRE